ncbi:MAG: hypothetical protein JST41_00705 [Bacteroidetes bacterium]|nr:hypothetical protein [Bacteroidota bacterium]HMU12754.1 hypothetical protein [Flavobacteriales bacterium]HMW96295.1 hypothetical protein [Flavobacteriales bacterium]
MNASAQTGLFRYSLVVAVLAVIFAVGCSKSDDVVAPCQDQNSSPNSRSMAADDPGGVPEPAPADGDKRFSRHTRGGTVTDPGAGINDDGDDEADGEGNKKRRLKP